MAASGTLGEENLQEDGVIVLLNRMCWNTRGWEFPSGSTSDSGYPGKNGFGHEEWNFQLKDAFNGFIYGYLYYRPSKETLKKSNNYFKIGFWTVNPNNKEKLLVGIYNKASYVEDDGEYKNLDAFFNKSGIYERRIEELITANPQLGLKRAKDEVYNSIRKKWLNFKCPIDQVIFFDVSENLILPEIINGKYLSNRYTKPLFINSIDNLLKDSKTKNQKTEKIKLPLVEDGYYREVSENLKYVTKTHNIFSNRLREWLSQNSYSNISQENDRVDIECIDSESRFCRIEIKITHGVGTTRSIREALGQLLEYNHYGYRNKADIWVIVLDKIPSKTDLKFLKIIKAKYKMPLEIGWFENNSFIFNKLE